MDVWQFLLMLLVAAIIGGIGQSVAGFSTPGCAMSIVIGFVGAFLGRTLVASFMFSTFKLRDPLPVKIGTQTFPVLWSVLGAALLVLVLRLLLGRRTPSAPG